MKLHINGSQQNPNFAENWLKYLNKGLKKLHIVVSAKSQFAEKGSKITEYLCIIKVAWNEN